MCIEAISNENITRLYTAMDWIESCTDENIIKIQNKWSDEDNVVKQSPVAVVDSQTSTNQSQAPVIQSSFGNDSRDRASYVSSFFFQSGTRRSDHSLDRLISTEEEDWISLEDLGRCLQLMASKRNIIFEERILPPPLEKGTPNLIVTPSDNVYMCVLQIYSVKETSSLPTYDEVLLCSENTTLEEVNLFV
jgi:hypothetical protein